VFDTETMAELCVKQGRFDQAIDIFRRLAEKTGDPGHRRRFETRIAELAQDPSREPASALIETPGLRVTERAGTVEIEWRLPPDLAVPTLQLLLLRRTSDGIQADSRTLPLAESQGRTVVTVADLCGVRAAAGRLEGDSFVPLVRFPDRIT
jgi:pentatricopeptide repeat protein